MADLHSFNAKMCLTAAGCLIHNDKVLLIKHKKLGFWLNPGGHVEEGELPHQAAEREFWEETGVKVKAAPFGFAPEDTGSEYTPNPYSSNLHWISQENYHHRTQGKERSEKTAQDWGKGCEQHFNLLYLLEPVGSVDFEQNVEETDGIAWFTRQEVLELETRENIKWEVMEAFRIVAGH
jgi:8-oxo-dGTP pyrophosphatase MutT (NUDIX family)